MSVETAQHRQHPDHDDYALVELAGEPNYPGRYMFTRRAMGFMAASAAAQELTGRIDAVLRQSAPPDESPSPNPRRDDEPIEMQEGDYVLVA